MSRLCAEISGWSLWLSVTRNINHDDTNGALWPQNYESLIGRNMQKSPHQKQFQLIKRNEMSQYYSNKYGGKDNKDAGVWSSSGLHRNCVTGKGLWWQPALSLTSTEPVTHPKSGNLLFLGAQTWADLREELTIEKKYLNMIETARHALEQWILIRCAKSRQITPLGLSVQTQTQTSGKSQQRCCSAVEGSRKSTLWQWGTGKPCGQYSLPDHEKVSPSRHGNSSLLFEDFLSQQRASS